MALKKQTRKQRGFQLAFYETPVGHVARAILCIRRAAEAIDMGQNARARWWCYQALDYLDEAKRSLAAWLGYPYVRRVARAD